MALERLKIKITQLGFQLANGPELWKNCEGNHPYLIGLKPAELPGPIPMD